jgi:hypothetical protein
VRQAGFSVPSEYLFDFNVHEIDRKDDEKKLANFLN